MSIEYYECLGSETMLLDDADLPVDPNHWTGSLIFRQ
jgi:hypothetical protein